MTARRIDEGWWIEGPGAAPPMGGWHPIQHHLPGDVFQHATSFFRSIHTKFEEATFELLPLLQSASNLFQAHQFSASLAIGWAVAEALLSRRWTAFFAANPDALTRVGMTLRQAKDPRAAVLIEKLASVGMLSEVRRKDLEVARAQRNAFVHVLKPCPPRLSFFAAQVAAQLIGEDAGCDFRIGSAYGCQI